MKLAIYCFDFGGAQSVSQMSSRSTYGLICEDEKRQEMSLEKGDVNHRPRGFCFIFLTS